MEKITKTEITTINRVCEWTRDHNGNYETTCGDMFLFNIDGTPEENGFKFCPYCAAQLKEKR